MNVFRSSSPRVGSFLTRPEGNRGQYSHLPRFEKLEDRWVLSTLTGTEMPETTPLVEGAALGAVEETAPVSAWMNVADPMDVDGNTYHSAADLLAIVQYLRSYGSGYALPETRPPEAPFVDCDGNGRVDTTDALDMVNGLRRELDGGGATWQNPLDRFDVDANGRHDANDVALILQDLKENGNPHYLPETRPAGAPYLDSDGNQQVDCSDALAVLSQLHDEAFVASEDQSEAGVDVVSLTSEFEPLVATLAEDIARV